MKGVSGRLVVAWMALSGQESKGGCQEGLVVVWMVL